MFESLAIIIRSGVALVFGVAVTILFTGGKLTRKNTPTLIGFCALVLLLQLLLWWMFGLEFTMKLYPLITHLPSVFLLALYFKRPWLMSITSVLTAYLCCQIPRWMGSLVGAVFGSAAANHIGYCIAVFVVFYLLKKYVASTVKQVMERSTRSCLFFCSVPLLYYLFDYITTIYTDMLYTGARTAVQFAPSVICTYYLWFVLMYYNESQKQIAAQRELDIVASHLRQAQLELGTMHERQLNTAIYRHDMRHHLSLINSFIADGDLMKIKDYLASAVADIDALTPVRYCENETVNLILSTFDTRAKKQGVALCVNVKLPQELGISDTELCALLSNALENAITAAAKTEDEKLRKVYIHALINGEKLVISTENAYVGKVNLEGELPKSTNTETGHGFGVKSMVSIVERHGGLYSFETKDGVFILQLMLPLG